ncbi:MAG: biotin-dependent carboxyltransferase, partial [Myxococcales bacterium]
SGPLDGALAAAANEAAGNAPGEAAIEAPLGPCEVEARGDVVVSVDGAPPRRLRDGERLAFASGERAVAYLAVAGGLDTPVVQGSRAVLVTAALGGRALRRGDVLPVGDRTARAPRPPVRPPAPPPEPAPLLFVPGPHLDRFPPGALAHLAATGFAVSALSNRVGVRLDGAPVPTGAGRLDLPSPMVRGAIEVTSDGTPIVLGPDHPVTGGYPVIGVLTLAAQGKLARLRPGQRVRLVPVG